LRSITVKYRNERKRRKGVFAVERTQRALKVFTLPPSLYLSSAGFGFCYAWKALTHAMQYDSTLLALAVIAVPLIMALSWRHIHPISDHRLLIGVVTALGVAGTFLLFYPSFLGSTFMGIVLGTTLVTCANVALMILYVDIYGSLGFFNTIIVLMIAYLFGSGAYWLVALMPALFLPGITLFMPVISAVCLLASVATLVHAKIPKHPAVADRHESTSVIPFPGKIVFVATCYAFACGINRPTSSDSIDITSQFFAAIAIGLFALLLLRKSGIYQGLKIAMPLMMCALLLEACFGEGGTSVISHICANSGYALLHVILIAYICDKTYRFGLSAIWSCGISRSIMYVGFYGGFYLASGAIPSLTSNQTTVHLAVLVITIIVIAVATVSWLIEGDPLLEFKRSDGRVPDDSGVGTLLRTSDVPADGADYLPQLKEFYDVLSLRCDEIKEEFNLSQREQEVLFLLARGHSIPRIEQELFISNSTVKTHVRHIYNKTGIHSRDELKILLNVD
jgi:DNA-binding CsgD family transcriptional regulator